MKEYKNLRAMESKGSKWEGKKGRMGKAGGWDVGGWETGKDTIL